MADLCQQCALDTWGEDIGDLAGLSTPDDTAARRYPIALCEGCDPIQVDHTGRRIEDENSFPRSCHGETLRRLAHAPVCETV